MGENTVLERLAMAKEAVRWLLEHSYGLVDMHGIVYWAGEVERLREQIKNET